MIAVRFLSLSIEPLPSQAQTPQKIHGPDHVSILVCMLQHLCSGIAGKRHIHPSSECAHASFTEGDTCHHNIFIFMSYTTLNNVYYRRNGPAAEERR